MNAFDFVITVAFGSTLATVLLSKSVTLMEGICAFATLVTLQFLVTWLSVRFPRLEKVVKSRPSLLFFGGQYVTETMRKQRVTEEEVRQAVRKEGIGDMADVAAVVLEANGNLVVLKNLGNGSAMADT